MRPARVATRDDGKRPTKADAIRKRDEMMLEKRAGILPTTATVGAWLDYWLEHVVDPAVADGRLKAATATYYRSYCEQWLAPTVGRVKLAELGPEHVRGLHAAMRKAGKSPTTIRNAHATLRRALGVAVVERRVGVNWAREVAAPTASDNPFAQLTVDEAGNVFVVASRDPRELARVHVAILCGLRQGEALALRWDDINLDAGTIRVEWSATRVKGRGRVRVRPKSRRSTRTVPIPSAALASLTTWRAESGGRGFVFHGFDGPDAIEDASRDHRAWKMILADAGVPAVPLHGARGTCATMLEALGYPPRLIADILGQADVRITETHYARSDAWQRADAVNDVGDLFELEAQ